MHLPQNLLNRKFLFISLLSEQCYGLSNIISETYFNQHHQIQAHQQLVIKWPEPEDEEVELSDYLLLKCVMNIKCNDEHA